ncbi:MAG: DUF362 domain-containing protein, partial [Desulfobulbia bacterium]
MNQRAQQQTTNRRDFLLRLLKGGISIGAACSLSYWLYDATGPGVAREEKDLVTLPDFSLPSRKGKMSIVTGGDRSETIRR